jgi:hypothetical protein
MVSRCRCRLALLRFASDSTRRKYCPASLQWHEAHETKNATKLKLSGVCGKDADLLPATL